MTALSRSASSFAYILPNLAGEAPRSAFSRLHGGSQPPLEPLALEGVLNGKELLSTFALPFGLNVSQMRQAFREIWDEHGYLEAPEMLIRFHEHVICGARHDPKLIQAVRSNFHQDPLTSALNKSSGAISQGLAHLYCKERNIPCAIFKGDISGFTAFNEHVGELFVAAKLQPQRPSTPDSPSWKHADAVARIMLTHAFRRADQAMGELGLATRPRQIIDREGGDEFGVFTMGISKQQYERAVKPFFYLGVEEVVTSFGYSMFRHTKYPEIAKRGLGAVLGGIDLMDPDNNFFGAERESLLAKAAWERKVDSLVMGTCRHHSLTLGNRAATEKIQEQFSIRIEAIATNENKDAKVTPQALRPLYTSAARLSDSLFLSLSDGQRPMARFRTMATKRSAKKLFSYLQDTALMLHAQHDIWRGPLMTTPPHRVTDDGYALMPLDTKTARDLVAARDALYTSPKGPFYATYKTPLVRPTPADPFDNSSEQMFAPSWMGRLSAVERHIAATQPKLPDIGQRQLAVSVAAHAAIDPPSRLLMPDSFKEQVERYAQDNARLQERLAQGAGADPLIQEALAAADGKATALQAWAVVIKSPGMVGAINDKFSHADGDRFIGFAARKLVETGRRHGFFIAQASDQFGMEWGNSLMCHSLKASFVGLLPPVIEDKGAVKVVTAAMARGFLNDYAQSFEFLRPVPVADHLRELGSLQTKGRTRATYEEMGLRTPQVHITYVPRIYPHRRNPGGDIYSGLLKEAETAWGQGPTTRPLATQLTRN